MKKVIKVGSDFSGVGAFDYAIQRVANAKGFDVNTVYACDWDKYARISYIATHGEPPYYPKDVYEREIPEESLDIYMTSPPCQAFSLAGKRLGKEDGKGRGILFFNSLEFIEKNKPRFFIFENVKGLLSDDNGRTFQEWVNLLGGKSVNGVPILFPYEGSVDYHLYWQVLNTKEHGVPQNRERVFIIGIRDDKDNDFRYPIKEHLTKRLKDILEEEVIEKFYLSDAAVEKCLKSSANADMLEKDIPESSRCIPACYYNIPFDGQYIKTKTNLDKYYLSDKMVDYVSKPGTKTFFYEPTFIDENTKFAKPLTTEQGKRAGTTNYVKVTSNLDKYYLSEKMLENLSNKGNKIIDNEVPENSATICSTYAKMDARDQQYVKVQSNLEKYYLSDKMIAGFLAHNKRHIEEKNQEGFNWKPKDENDVANCLRANGALCATDNTLKVSKEVRTEESKKTRKKTGTNDFRGKEIEFRDQDHMNALTTSLTNDHLIQIETPICNCPNCQKSESTPILKPLYHYGNGNSNERMVYDKDGIAPCMVAAMGTGGGHIPAVEIPKCNCTNCQDQEYIVGTWRTHEDGKGFRATEDNNCPTISARAREDGSGQPVIMKVEQTETPKCSCGKCTTDEWIADYRADEGLRIRKDNISPRINASIQDYSEWNAKAGTRNPPLVGQKITELSPYQGDKVTQSTDDAHPCLAASGGNKLKGVGIQESNFRVRRLTPLECFRLQDFPDEHTAKCREAGVSDSQLYKQAGNSITVRVLEKILMNLPL